MTLPRSVRNLLIFLPLAFLGASFVLLLLNPNELYWPYSFWGEFSRIWKKTYFFFIALIGLLWAKKKGWTSVWIQKIESIPEKKFLWGIFAIAAGLRLAWVLVSDNQPYADGLTMWEQAKHMVNGLGFTSNGIDPTAVEAPGYPFFLALLIKFLGENIFAVKISHIFWSAPIPVLMYFIGKAAFGKPVGILTAVFVAFCPNAILATSLFMNEHPYLLFTLLALLLILSDLNHPHWIKLALAGVFLGLSDLTRGVFFLFPFALIIYYAVAGKDLVVSVRNTLLVLGFTAVVVLPWTYRNYKVLGYPIPICTSAGSGLYVMNSPIADPYTTELMELKKYHPDWQKFHPNPEVARYLAGSKYAMDWIRSDFRRFMKLGAGKIIAYFGLNKAWSNYYNTKGSHKFLEESLFIKLTEQPLKYYFAFHFSWFLLGIYFLLKRYLFRDRMEGPQLIFFTVLFIIGMHFLFTGWPRYRYTLEPFVYLLSAFAISHLISPSYAESHSPPVR